MQQYSMVRWGARYIAEKWKILLIFIDFFFQKRKMKKYSWMTKSRLDTFAKSFFSKNQ